MAAKLSERLNGNVWKWTTSIAVMAAMFLLGMMTGDGMASWRLSRMLAEQTDATTEQLVWNGRIEERINVIEQRVSILDDMRASLIRIETQMGIERGGVQCPSPD